jgi:two-component system response regulator AtoC
MKKRRILIIEDEANMRHMLEVLLEKSGFEVTSAPDGQAGLDVVGDQDFHFILCDIKMPRMDGMAFLKSASDSVRDHRHGN